MPEAKKSVWRDEVKFAATATPVSAITRSKLWVFLPQPTMNYRVVRGTTLDSFPDVIQSFTAPTIPFVEVRDTTAPAGRAFYRLEELAP